MAIDDVAAFNIAIIEATSDLVCAYKPNVAFYEALGPERGYAALRKTLAAIPPHVITLADAKRGDVTNTARAYVQAIFDDLGFDACTVNPYVGYDSTSHGSSGPRRRRSSSAAPRTQARPTCRICSVAGRGRSRRCTRSSPRRRARGIGTATSASSSARRTPARCGASASCARRCRSWCRASARRRARSRQPCAPGSIAAAAGC